jgi:hypothetical protein
MVPKAMFRKDPVVIVKMMLVLFLDNVRSERELMLIIPERLDYMWLLGYGLDDTIPNHSVLSKARKRWGQEVFVAVFSRVVAQCARAGLVEGTKIHADSSLVAANASLNSVREWDAVTLDQIQRACREQTEKLDETEANKDQKNDNQDPDRRPGKTGGCHVVSGSWDNTQRETSSHVCSGKSKHLFECERAGSPTCWAGGSSFLS